MDEATKARLAEVFQIVFELPPGVDLAAIAPGETSAWDSLGHVSLITAISSEFEVQITAIDSLDINSFESAAAVLSELLHG